MEQTLGARLRAQREQRGISLEEISKETKIKLTLLERLEHDDVTYWPLGLFRRAYLRSYALMIGANPETLVREFLELHPDPSEQAPDEQPQPTGLRRAMALLRPRTFKSETAPRGVTAASARLTTGPARVSDLKELMPDEDGISPTAVHTTVVSVESHQAESSDAQGATFGDWSQPEHENSEAADLAPSHPRTLAPSHLLASFSEVCARIPRVSDWDEMAPLLGDAADLLSAVGVTVWSRDGRLGALVATWAHGYSHEIVARMPRVRRDADNALADAWRDERTCIVAGDSHVTGAIVIPMMTSSGCVGVLAIELAGGREQDPTVRSLATILAAQLAALLGAAPLAEAASA